jgi:hypothetical protein
VQHYRWLVFKNFLLCGADILRDGRSEGTLFMGQGYDRRSVGVNPGDFSVGNAWTTIQAAKSSLRSPFADPELDTCPGRRYRLSSIAFRRGDDP